MSLLFLKISVLYYGCITIVKAIWDDGSVVMLTESFVFLVKYGALAIAASCSHAAYNILRQKSALHGNIYNIHLLHI